MTDLIDLADLKSFMAISSGGDDSVLTGCITAASNWIEARCHRSLTASTEDRYYNLEYSRLVDARTIYLDEELQSLDGILNGNGTTISSTGCWLEPRNGPPYSAIRLKPPWVFIFNVGQELTISGSWGHSTGPSELAKQACRRLAQYYYDVRKSGVFDVTAFPEAGVMQVPKGIAADVVKMLEDGGLIRRW